MKTLILLSLAVVFSFTLIALFFCINTSSFAATFNPMTVEELINDITTANSNDEVDDINLVPGMVYTITGMEVGVPFSGGNGLPVILSDSGNSLTINGNGATIERDAALFTTNPCSGLGLKFRIIQTSLAVVLVINDLTIQNGCSDNLSGSGVGGAILNFIGNITLNNTTISDNEAEIDGGGISNLGNNLTLINSTISNNMAGNQGGGINNNNSGNLELTNTTITGNSAPNNGGGIFINNGIVDIKNNLIVDNSASLSGNNCSSIGGTLNDNGGNISDDNADTCMFAFNADWDTATMLGPLQYNGGTFTHALIETIMPSNPAIDAIVPANCTDQQMMPLAITIDQRNFLRPYNTNCDVGAFELQPIGMLTIEKITFLAGGEDFEFLGTGVPVGCVLMDSFHLDDAESLSCILPLGMYTVDEVVKPRFALDIVCNEIPTSETPTGVTIDIGDADNIACTFINSELFDVNVIIDGNGIGTVTYAPGGVICPGNCSETFGAGTIVTLTPTPSAPDSIFAGWSGPADCIDGIIDLIADTACTATFNLNTFDLDINLAGTGGGNVSGSGIDCGDGGADCMETYFFGTGVTLTPTPDPVSSFAGFTGDPDCEDGVVTIDADKSCTATFDFLPLILNPIFPAIASNPNIISADNATPSGPVAFLWGFLPGNVIVGGPTCNGLELDIKNPRILSIINAFPNGHAEYIFFIPLIGDLELPILTQAVDIDTCRKSEVVQNIIRKE